MVDMEPLADTLSLNIVFVLGCPGFGKGTVCSHVAQQFDFCHISAGDYLRSLHNTTLYLPAKEHAVVGPDDLATAARRSRVIRDDMMVDILLFRLTQEFYYNGRTRFIIDGFPRVDRTTRAFRELVGPAPGCYGLR